MRRALCSIAIGTALSVFTFSEPGLHSWQMSDEDKLRLTNVLKRRYELAPDTKLQIVERESLPSLKELTVFSLTPGSPFQKDLDVTSDGRLLVEPIGNIGVETDQAEAMEAARISARLKRQNSPRLGDTSAALTVVMYADYQCEYCRDAYAVLRDRVSHDKNLELVFQHHPLASHNWSRSAARSAICIYEQSSQGFWRFSDFMFRHQTEISVDNLPSKVVEFVKSSPELKQEKFGQCEASETPDHVLLEDENSGFANGVNATPTFFVNGTKKVGVGNSESEFMRTLDAIEHRR